MNRPAAPNTLSHPGYEPDKDLSIVRDSRRSRPKYFEGQFLTARDLNTEQNYLLARQADFARALGFGVIKGLRVVRLEKVAPGVPGASTMLRVTEGTGITPAGEVVQLPEDRVVELAEIALMRELNARFGLSQEPQQPFASLDGLFVFGLRQVEFTANPTPVFPASLTGRDRLRDGAIIEATAFTLVPYASTAADESRPEQTLARVAREIFHDGKPPASPGGVLPLAMMLLRAGVLVWVDEFLVRREAGDDDRFGFGFAPRALAEAHFHHYRARIEDAEIPLDSRRVAAADHFEVLPPGGPLPPGVVDAQAFTQTFFPPEASVDITLVPEDELPSLMDESLDLPAVDLRLKPEDNDALAILILAPVPRAMFDDTLTTVAPKPLAAGLGVSNATALPAPLAGLLRKSAAATPAFSFGKARALRAGVSPSVTTVTGGATGKTVAAPSVVTNKVLRQADDARETIQADLAELAKTDTNVRGEVIFTAIADMERGLAEAVTIADDDERAIAIEKLKREVGERARRAPADLSIILPPQGPEAIMDKAVTDLEQRVDEAIKEGGDGLADKIKGLLKNCENLIQLIQAATFKLALERKKKLVDRIKVLVDRLNEAMPKPPAEPPPPATDGSADDTGTEPAPPDEPEIVPAAPTGTETVDAEPDDDEDGEFASDPIADARWSEVLSKVTKFWYVRRRNLPPPGRFASSPRAVTYTLPPPVEIIETETKPRIEEHETPEMMKTLAEAKLDSSYLSLRMVTSLREHEALARMVSALVDGHPRILLHEAVERLIAGVRFDPDTPSKNFDLMLRATPRPELPVTIIEKVRVDVTAPAFARDIEKVLGADAMNDSALAEPLARSGQLAAVAIIAQMQGVKAGDIGNLREKLLHHAARRRPSDITTEVKRFLTRNKEGVPK